MAITHVTSVRNGLANYVVDLIDVGGGGNLIIMTSGDVEVATLDWSNPAFGAASGGTATASAIAPDTNATGGVAALFKVVDNAQTEIFRGSVTATGGGGDIELSSTSIGATDTVQINNFTYSASL